MYYKGLGILCISLNTRLQCCLKKSQIFEIKYSVPNVTKFTGIHKKFIQNMVEEIFGDIMNLHLLEIKVKDLKLKQHVMC